MKNIILTLIVASFLSSCSVGMALSGKEPPNLGGISKDKTRSDVERELGAPINTSYTNDGNRIDIYEYEIGNEPSTGRAIGHGALDLLTLGGWEIIGTPIEGFTGDTYTATVTYDKSDKVLDIKTKKKTKNI